MIDIYHDVAALKYPTVDNIAISIIGIDSRVQDAQWLTQSLILKYQSNGKEG